MPTCGSRCAACKWINSFAYYDDGFQFELTPGYHVFPTSSIFSVVQAARARGVALPDDFVALVEKAHEMYLFAVQPNHHLADVSTTATRTPSSPRRCCGAAAEAFGRERFPLGWQPWARRAQRPTTLARLALGGILCDARQVGRGWAVPLLRRRAVGRVTPARGQAELRASMRTGGC